MNQNLDDEQEEKNKLFRLLKKITQIVIRLKSDN